MRSHAELLLFFLPSFPRKRESSVFMLQQGKSRWMTGHPAVEYPAFAGMANKYKAPLVHE
jgi:hypothetical protein